MGTSHKEEKTPKTSPRCELKPWNKAKVYLSGGHFHICYPMSETPGPQCTGTACDMGPNSRGCNKLVPLCIPGHWNPGCCSSVAINLPTSEVTAAAYLLFCLPIDSKTKILQHSSFLFPWQRQPGPLLSVQRNWDWSTCAAVKMQFLSKNVVCYETAMIFPYCSWRLPTHHQV